jgi:hypothetical protein
VLYLRNDSRQGAIVNIPLDAELRAVEAGDSLTVDLKRDIHNLRGTTPPNWDMLTFDGAEPAKRTPPQ